MKKCPFCKEEIQSEAIKCKFCGSNLLEVTNTSSISKSDYTKYIILAILLPVVGLIMGIVFMTKPSSEEKKAGESILVWSILFMIVWGILGYWYAPELFSGSIMVLPTTTY